MQCALIRSFFLWRGLQAVYQCRGDMSREKVLDESHKEPGKEGKDSELGKSENSDLDENLSVSADTVDCNANSFSASSPYTGSRLGREGSGPRWTQY